MRNILLISDLLEGGGAESVLRSVANDLAAHGAALTVWTLQKGEAARQSFPPGTRFRPYPFWRGACKRGSLRWAWYRLCRLLFEGFLLKLRRWDAVLAMKEGPSMRLASRLRARKKLAWVHTDFSGLHWSAWHFRDNEEERRCMAAFDAVVCVSETVGESVQATVGDPGNLRVLYNPIDVSAILRKAEAPVSDIRRPVGKPLLVTVGRLSPVKRYDLLIDLCRELSAEFDFELWIIGGGEQEAALREKDCPCVKLLGPRANPYPYLRQADWFVSASESESYGLAVQEALILGIPVLAAACPGIAESLDEDFGLLTAPDPEALKAGLRRILEEPALGDGYRRRIRADYDRDGLWTKRLAAIRELIDE